MGLPLYRVAYDGQESYFSDTMAEFFVPGDADDLARCIRLLYTSLSA